MWVASGEGCIEASQGWVEKTRVPASPTPLEHTVFGTAETG